MKIVPLCFISVLRLTFKSAVLNNLQKWGIYKNILLFMQPFNLKMNQFFDLSSLLYFFNAENKQTMYHFCTKLLDPNWTHIQYWEERGKEQINTDDWLYQI